MILLRFMSCVLAVVSVTVLHAQTDTLHIGIADAERVFLQSNLQLLAARFNIDAARAAVTQAGLWSNPTIAFEQNVYNQFTRKWFDISGEGNTGIQLQQLITLAGKRGKRVHISELDAQLAQESFYNLLRGLKLELRTDIYDLYYLRQSLSFYDDNIATIARTVAAMESVYEHRAVLLSDLLRVKALLFSLQNERLGILAKIAENERSLRVLLHDSTTAAHVYVPHLDTQATEMIRPGAIILTEAVAIARENRPDLRKDATAVLAEEANLAYQKALAIPDITIGGLWSRAGSYIPDYYALTLSFDLPFFNRNQGNIEVSERTLDANRALQVNARTVMEQEVKAALERATETDDLYRSFDRKVLGQYQTLVDGMIANFQKRNMGVVEFTDFIESYRTGILQMHQLENARLDAIEALNYAVGTDLLTTSQR